MRDNNIHFFWKVVTIYMFIMNPLLLDRINVWIVIKDVLSNFFHTFKFVNLLLILMHFEHVARPESRLLSLVRFQSIKKTLPKINLVFSFLMYKC